MPRLNPLTLSVICALSITGCALPLQKQADQPAVQPVLAVRHGVSAEGMRRLGRYFEGQARHEQAIAAYREALERDPLSVDAYTGLGMAFAALGRHEEAIRQFQAAAVLAPHEAYVHNNLGYAYLLGGANEQAVKALEEATRLGPRHERSRENLRIARERLTATVAASPRPAPTQSAQAATVLAAETTPGLSLVEVAPQVFELRTSARQRNIEAKPLAPLPQKETRVAPARSFKLEVSNGNGVLGLAKRTARELASAAVRIARLTNQRPFEQARTEIQYRDGYAAEAAELAGQLEHGAQVVPNNQLAHGVDVRLVLGKDVQRQAVVRSSRRSRA
jgi:tetratricopeptide (TPR) repeat protein